MVGPMAGPLARPLLVSLITAGRASPERIAEMRALEVESAARLTLEGGILFHSDAERGDDCAAHAGMVAEEDPAAKAAHGKALAARRRHAPPPRGGRLSRAAATRAAAGTSG
jgi:hypothetical protein